MLGGWYLYYCIESAVTFMVQYAEIWAYMMRKCAL
jgi:hypothetical protein